jgi:hypothetical protein
MATQEERITARERVTAEYRPVLQNITYELTMAKELTLDQLSITQEFKQNISDVKERLTHIREQLTTILTLLKPSLLTALFCIQRNRHKEAASDINNPIKKCFTQKTTEVKNRPK